MDPGDVGALLIVSGVVFGGMSIVGGIANGWVRSRQRQNVAEMIQRERVALIERGTDPERLPSVQDHPLWGALENGSVTERQFMNRRRQMLLMIGLVMSFVGVALGVFLGFVAGDDVWTIGLMPFAVGLALLIASRFIKAE
ncbi:MAG: DUF6249 domain-containing protein [Candidatus Eisenbacteria bacterium]